MLGQWITPYIIYELIHWLFVDRKGLLSFLKHLISYVSLQNMLRLTVSEFRIVH